MRILAVEDEESTATVVRMLLENKLEAAVDIAPDCASARELLSSESYDLITLDYKLPDGDGLSLLEEIVARETALPVVMVTGKGDEKTAVSAFKLGASGYVVKDTRMSTLLIEEARSALARAELKAAEEALRQSEERYRIIAENITDTVWLMDMNMKQTWNSPSVKRLHGFTLEELNAMPLEKNYTPESASVVLKAMVENLTPENLADKNKQLSVNLELEFYKKDGSTFWGDVEMKLLRDAEGNPSGFMGVGHDITRRKTAEGALLESRDALEHQAQELRDMLTIAAHELRHPATIFKGYSHILLENADNLDSEVVRDALMSIDGASDRLARIVNQLMDASSIESGEMSLRFEELQPYALLNRVTAEFQGTGANVVTSDKTGAGAVFKADREKLRAVLWNLVENAVKFSPDGSPVGVCVEAVSGGFLFSVCDKGPGISDEHAELVFERFYQVEDAEHHSVPGIGLGLFIAKTIVDEHGGWIRCRPGEGGGSVFEFFIPERPKAEVSQKTD